MTTKSSKILNVLIERLMDKYPSDRFIEDVKYKKGLLEGHLHLYRYHPQEIVDKSYIDLDFQFELKKDYHVFYQLITSRDDLEKGKQQAQSEFYKMALIHPDPNMKFVLLRPNATVGRQAAHYSKERILQMRYPEVKL